MVRRNKVISAEAAAALAPDGATLGTIGGGGGLVEADALLAAIEERFLTTGAPTGLRVIHSLGLGDRDRRGLNRLAYEGLVRKVIGGHWIWSPRMQALAREEKIEAYVLPAGVTAQLMREIGAGRAGLITHVGLGTFVDPRQDGGRMNRSAKDELVELIEIDGRTLLRYKPFPVDVAVLRGSYADPAGNISQDEEPANLEAYAMALAAHNSGGVVIVQVRGLVEHGALPARSVRIPAALVDAVVVAPDQPQSYAFTYDPAISGQRRASDVQGPASDAAPAAEVAADARSLIAQRAARELFDDAVINFGFGIPDRIAKLIEARGETERYYQTIEHGTYGGALLDGVLFGFARNASCMIDSPSQFDFYGGGGLDIAFLGFGELDACGNVNVSRLGGVTVGPGGFIDIAQNARKVVFCGAFEAKGAAHSIDARGVRVERYGQVRKLVQAVDQITFSGQQALASGQEALYITERAVFDLTEAGLAAQGAGSRHRSASGCSRPDGVHADRAGRDSRDARRPRRVTVGPPARPFHLASDAIHKGESMPPTSMSSAQDRIDPVQSGELPPRPEFTDVLKAQSVLRRFLQPTPLHNYPALDAAAGAEVWVKHENYLPIGAFKLRGGINFMAALSAAQRTRGVATASTGNHGQSVAYAARLFGAKAVIAAPDNVNPVKLGAMRANGADVRVFGSDFEAAKENCQRIAAEEGLRFISSGDEPALIAGVATHTLELLHERPEIDAIIVPLGGGSGAAGAALAAKAINPRIRTIAVCAQESPAGYLTWRDRAWREAPNRTAAEGLATGAPFMLPQSILWDLLDDFVTVSEEEMFAAVRLYLESAKTLAEPAGASPLAALLRLGSELSGKKVALILSGGNISPQQLRSILDG